MGEKREGGQGVEELLWQGRDQDPEPSQECTLCVSTYTLVHMVCFELHTSEEAMAPGADALFVTWVWNESTLRHHTGLWALLTSVRRHVACMHPQSSDSL